MENTTLHINETDLNRISAYDIDGIHVILGEGDEMISGYYIDNPSITAEGSNYAWLKKNLEKRRDAIDFVNDLSNSSL